jgi:gas vesicle protein
MSEELNNHFLEDKPFLFHVTKGHFWAILLGAGILFLGMIIGACLTFLVAQNRIMRMVRHPDVLTKTMVQRLDRKLDLTETQREEIAKILRKHRSELSKIREEVNPRVSEQIEAMRREIRQVLNDEQRREWKDYIERLHRSWRSRPQRQMGPPGTLKRRRRNNLNSD